MRLKGLNPSFQLLIQHQGYLKWSNYVNISLQTRNLLSFSGCLQSPRC